MENPSLPHYHGEEPAHTEVVRQMLEKEDTFQELSDIFRQLGDAIYFFHAKDTALDEQNVAVNGVLDSKHFSDVKNRAWVFRTVGYGHDEKTWKDIMSALRVAGYDGPISIEHEDSLMTPNEGLQKAIAFLKDVMMFEDKGAMWWA